MISLKNVTFRYVKKDFCLSDFSLDITPGETVCLVGKNGSGKSTVLNLMGGLVFAKKGDVSVAGMAVKKTMKSQELRKKVGMLFQNPDNQILFSTVGDECAFALKNFKTNKAEWKDKIKKALASVDMAGYESRNPFELSLGQKQRIALASVLVYEPDVLLLDEPTSMLDEQGKKRILEILAELKRQGKTIVFSSNSLSEIIVADRTVVLDKGKIILDIPKQQLSKHLDDLEEAFGLSFLLKTFRLVNTDDISEEGILAELERGKT